MASFSPVAPVGVDKRLLDRATRLEFVGHVADARAVADRRAAVVDYRLLRGRAGVLEFAVLDRGRGAARLLLVGPGAHVLGEDEDGNPDDGDKVDEADGSEGGEAHLGLAV